MTSEHELRQQVADVCRRMYEKNFVAANDGNVTARLDDQRILATPSGWSKGDITPDCLIICDMTGARVTGKGKVTTEVLLHCEVYRQRADVGAVVHAHPVYASALTVAGVTLDDAVLPEVAIMHGRIPTAQYATPTSSEGPDAIRDLIKTYDAILLDHHGALTAGRDPWDAYFKMERLEHTAQIIAVARQLGEVRKLTDEQIERLIEALTRHGITAKITRERG